jgi:YegS/Rv2252/BmrU family lipid kinase
MTEKKGDAAEFVRRFGVEYDTLVCCGGDGTLSETINGLARLKPPPPLGYIPVGTTNDFANSLGLSRNLKKAAADIVSAQPRLIDIGQFGKKNFLYIAAFGALTEVSYSTPQETKNTLGHLAYILEGISRLSDIYTHPATIEYDQGKISGDFVFGGVTNTTSVAGLVRLSSDFVSLTDGMFELMLIKPPKSVAKLRRIIGGILTQNYDPDHVTFVQTSRVRFFFDNPVPWTLDGENGGEHMEVDIRILPEKIPFLHSVVL